MGDWRIPFAIVDRAVLYRMPSMRRVIVIGSGGTGKTSVASEIGRRRDLPVINLDALYWKPGWVETPVKEWESLVKRLIAEEAWVMDGNYGGTLDLRLFAADTVIFLDLPRLLCVWRIVKRRIRHHRRPRPEMGKGCPERLDTEFLRWIWTYPEKRRPRILDKLRSVELQKRVVILRSRREIHTFLESLSADTAGLA